MKPNGDEKLRERANRREWTASALMLAGLLFAYGALFVQAVLFILPRELRSKRRRIFAGSVDSYEQGTVQTVYDLQGNPILIRRAESGFRAFSSVCPHLGCKVHWESDRERFFCPCHRGVFNPRGEAVSGPPADAGQSLRDVPLLVDEKSGVVYLEVPDRGGRA